MTSHTDIGNHKNPENPKLRRIVLFTVDNIDFCPPLLLALTDHFGDNIAGIFVSKTHLDLDFIRKRFFFFVRNLYPFCIRLSDLWRFFSRKLSNLFKHKKGVVSIMREAGFPASYIEDINAPQTLESLRGMNPDIFVFCLFDKIAGLDFIQLPALGTCNLHLGKLPEYRGGLSSFWVLRFNDPEAGATLHEVEQKLDSGPIISEFRFPVEVTSMKELMKETIKRSAPMVISGIEKILNGDTSRIQIAGRPEGYHFIPGREDFKAFYRNGCWLI